MSNGLSNVENIEHKEEMYFLEILFLLLRFFRGEWSPDSFSYFPNEIPENFVNIVTF